MRDRQVPPVDHREPGLLRLGTMGRAGLTLALFFALLPCLRAQSAEDYIVQADQLVGSYQWQEALALLQKAVRTYPGNVELLTRYGAQLLNTGQAVPAEAVFRAALALDSEDARILSYLGQAQSQSGKYEAAIRSFEASLERKPVNPEAAYGAAMASLLAGDRARALVFAKRSVESQESTAAARRLYASLLNLAGDYAESYRQLREALIQEPGNAQLLYDLSETRRLDGKRSQALEYLDLAVDSDPENPLYHEALARIYRELKQDDLATQEAERAAVLMKAFEVYAEAVRIAGAGDLPSAIHKLRSVVASNPDFLTGKMFLADLMARHTDLKQAGDLYREILRRDPNRSDARQKAAWIKTQLGDPASALELLREQDPQRRQPTGIGAARTLEQNALLTAAHWAMREQNWQEALTHLRQVELRNPLNPQLLKLISSCLRETGCDDEALQYLDRAQNIQPEDAEIKTIRIDIRRQEAYRLLTAKKWKAAAAVFDWLSKTDGPTADYLLNLGYCRESVNDLTGATGFYEEGLQKDPDAHWARKNLGSCLLRLLKYRQAVVHWEAVVAHEKSSDNLLRLGICYANLERTPEAERVLEQALSLQPGSGEILYNLGVVRHRLKKVEPAWDAIRQAARAGYQPAWDLLAKAQLGVKR